MSIEIITEETKNAKTKTSGRILNFLIRYGAYFAFVLVLIYFSVRSPVFMTSANLIRVLLQAAVLAIAALGMATVFIGGGSHVIEGGIDLSVGAQIGLITGIYSVLMSKGTSPALAIGIGLIVAIVIGLFNGISVEYFRLLPLLATLAMMFIVGGVEMLVTNNLTISVKSPFVSYLNDGSILGLPVPVVILLITLLFYLVLVELSPFGSHIKAIGGNRDAAIRAGINVKLYVILTYVFSSLAAAISSIILLGRLSGSTRGIGSLLFMDILLAAYVSAMFSKRWVINIPGVFLGAFFVGVLNNGFTMINVPTYMTSAVKGILILIVVAATSLQKKKADD